MSMHPLTRWIIPAAVALAAAWTPQAQADSFTRKGITYKPITILQVKNGEMVYTSNGLERRVKLEEVDSLGIDTVPELAQADKYLEKKDWTKAANSYRAAWRKAKPSWLKNWIARRRVYALDQAGNIDVAVREYNDLTKKDDSDFFLQVAPKNLPTKKKQRQELLEDAKKELKSVKNAKVKGYFDWLIAQLDSDKPQAADGASSAAPGPPIGANAPGIGQERRAAVDDLKVLIDNKKFKECLEKVEPQLQARTAQGQLPRLLYYQGRALAGLDKDMDATVALMRVVIHFPDHKYAALARLYAGDLFQKRGDRKQAKALWAEAQGSAHNDPELKEGLQKRLN